MKFNELGLKDNILSAISEMGYEEPTPIQQKAIPYLLENDSDLIGLASTGTGKTAAFGLPLINKIDSSSKNTQGLIICPTRELCIQIARDLDAYSSQLRDVKITAVYGGTDISKQIRQIERGTQIIVATPGRLVDLINRKKVKLWEVETVVLDEADEMLNMGFKEDIDSILQQTPDHKNVWLFSATMSKEVARIAKNYMTEPFEITVGGKNETNKNIEHHYYVVNERDRYTALKGIIDFSPNIYGLIFCRTRRDTAAVADKLMANGYNAEPLHGDLSQAQRDRVMDKFRSKTLQILVATDVAARGIDVDDITHVIHYQLPEDVENYTHRSGRTARAGKKGTSIALINTRESRKIKSIERIINSDFQLKKVPSPDEICMIQLQNTVASITDAEIDTTRIEKYMPVILEQFEDVSKEDVLKKFLSVEFNKFLSYYENVKDVNAKSSKGGREEGFKSRRGGKSDSRDDENRQRFFVALGRKDGFNHGALLRLLLDNTGMNKGAIGKIDILEKFSFFDADKSETEKILSKMQTVDFEGQTMNIEKTKGGGDSEKGGRKPSSRRTSGSDRTSSRDRGNSGNSGNRSRRRSYNN